MHLEHERVSQAACLQRRHGQLLLLQEHEVSLRLGSLFPGSTLQESYGSHCRRGHFLLREVLLLSLNVHRTFYDSLSLSLGWPRL